MKHYLRWQGTIPKSLTRNPEQQLRKVVEGAAEHLNSLVPGAKNRDFRPVYEERTTKLGVVLDVLVVMSFDYPGPLPPHVQNLKQYAEIQQQLRRGKGN